MKSLSGLPGIRIPRSSRPGPRSRATRLKSLSVTVIGPTCGRRPAGLVGNLAAHGGVKPAPPQHGAGQAGHGGRKRQDGAVFDDGRAEIIQGPAVQKNGLDTVFQVGRGNAGRFLKKTLDALTARPLDEDAFSQDG